ncbi:hypothetical protein J3R30DRAFT_3696050 [Lentinula aciculospora]|uniref:Uncharacterized protein n=1 Tax=Lentinula aciculospora TaxID=153920 RepID=A0A9W9DWF2_9AGAR|nr:hypothetical protein J3R30DRAFT_3696050 [Lentinula aciculospora]
MNSSISTSLASTSRPPVHHILSSEEDVPPSKSQNVKSRSKRKRDVQPDVYYGKLAFNHDISVHYHKLCSEACRNQLQMKHGIADLGLLQEVLQLVDGRISEMQSTMPQISPLTKKPKQLPTEELPGDYTIVSARSPLPSKMNVRKDEESEISPARKIASNTKRNLSLYRTDTSPARSTPSTPFDLLLEHKDMAASNSPRTPTKKLSPSKIRNGTLGVSPTTITIISDDEDENIPAKGAKGPMNDIPNLLQELNNCRRKLSTSLGRLPEEILPLRTLRQLSIYLPSDYKVYQWILADTSGIPVTELEEREAYVAEKWEETGNIFFALCMQFQRRREEQASATTESTTISGAAATFKKTIAKHRHPLGKPIDLNRHSFSIP